MTFRQQHFIFSGSPLHGTRLDFLAVSVVVWLKVRGQGTLAAVRMRGTRALSQIGFTGRHEKGDCCRQWDRIL